VNVDEAWGYYFAFGVDFFPRFTGDMTDLGDATVYHCDISFDARVAGPVKNSAVANDEIKGVAHTVHRPKVAVSRG
jgi:hypothetical protein